MKPSCGIKVWGWVLVVLQPWGHAALCFPCPSPGYGAGAPSSSLPSLLSKLQPQDVTPSTGGCGSSSSDSAFLVPSNGHKRSRHQAWLEMDAQFMEISNSRHCLPKSTALRSAGCGGEESAWTSAGRNMKTKLIAHGRLHSQL